MVFVPRQKLLAGANELLYSSLNVIDEFTSSFLPQVNL